MGLSLNSIWIVTDQRGKTSKRHDNDSVTKSDEFTNFLPVPHPTLENLLSYADRCHIKDYFPLNNATIKY